MHAYPVSLALELELGFADGSKLVEQKLKHTDVSYEWNMMMALSHSYPRSTS